MGSNAPYDEQEAIFPEEFLRLFFRLDGVLLIFQVRSQTGTRHDNGAATSLSFKVAEHAYERPRGRPRVATCESRALT